ncbi:MAG: HK97 gp10 family phage protein [Anaerohalosphaeraceae bacterium]
MIHAIQTHLKQFNQEVDDFAKTLVPEKVILLQKKIVLEALKRLVMKTPVDTGRARGNWQVTIGRPATAAIEAVDKSGGETIKKGLAAIADMPPYQVVWISNNVDYIEFLEDGTSRQAPEGMMSLTLEELKVMFSKAVE